MSTDTMRAPPLGSPLPADVARCPGYWARMSRPRET